MNITNNIQEVGGYYQAGMKIPDDVTILWSDDNSGNIQRLPIPSEVNRIGGAGVYYHFDYVGAPRYENALFLHGS